MNICVTDVTMENWSKYAHIPIYALDRVMWYFDNVRRRDRGKKIVKWMLEISGVKIYG